MGAIQIPDAARVSVRFGRPAIYSLSIGLGVILITWVGADVPFTAVNLTASLMGLLFWSGVVRAIIWAGQRN